MKKFVLTFLVAISIVTVGVGSGKPVVPVLSQSDPFPNPVPAAVIPETVPLNGLAVLTVKPQDPVPKLYSCTYEWIIYPPNNQVFAWPDNTKCAFAVGGKTVDYDITLIAVYLFVDESTRQYIPKITKISSVIHVGTPGPGPGPGPAPGPTGGYAKIIYDLCIKFSSSKTDATLLGRSFRSVLSSYAAGGVEKTPQAINDATAASNRLLLGDHLEAWKPVLDQLAVQANADKIITVDQMITTWDQIAAGFEAYAK